ncbi:MAG: SDR family NAD(P)-dependent oxidoreductase [Lachnospiraceae bacterium]|nr:SDR family NAD(P)-dependent oxidoreductase [Lachnospiraceae bacterium]
MNRKKALITGASRGIGKAIAKELAKAGYDLYVTCVSSEATLNEYAKELEKAYNISCSTLIGDISDPNVVDCFFDEIDDLDVLVNNAGISYIGLLTDMSNEEWNSIISTNLSSAFYCAKRAIPLMLQKKSGKIINISSVWGERGASMEVAYSTTKGGINSFTKALAKELAPSNIQVNAIACGLIDTDMNSHFSEEDMAKIINEIPADRIGKPEEVAHLALQLTDGNNYLTGQVIGLDGGWI